MGNSSNIAQSTASLDLHRAPYYGFNCVYVPFVELQIIVEIITITISLFIRVRKVLKEIMSSFLSLIYIRSNCLNNLDIILRKIRNEFQNMMYIYIWKKKNFHRLKTLLIKANDRTDLRPAYTCIDMYIEMEKMWKSRKFLDVSISIDKSTKFR